MGGNIYIPVLLHIIYTERTPNIKKGCEKKMLKLVNGIHMNMYAQNTKWEFIPLSKREFNTILNKNRKNIKSYIGHQDLANRLKVERNRENTYTEIGDILLVYCGNNRSKATNKQPTQSIRYIIIVTEHTDYYSQKRLMNMKEKLMRGALKI